MSSRHRELVDLQWRRFGQVPPSDEGALRVADLPVDPNASNTVLDISYTIDLSGEPSRPVEHSNVSGVLRSLIQEPA